MNGGTNKVIPKFIEPKHSPFIPNVTRQIKQQRYNETAPKDKKPFKFETPPAYQQKPEAGQQPLVDLQVYPIPEKPVPAQPQLPPMFVPAFTPTMMYPPQYQAQYQSQYQTDYPQFYPQAGSLVPNTIPVIKNYTINASGPVSNHSRVSAIYEDILPSKQFQNTFITLGERINLYQFIRSVFIRHGDGENIGLHDGGDDSLLRYLKFIELNPYNVNQLSDNPYKGLPQGMLIYRSCYPIRHHSNSNSVQCAANSVGLNIRIYQMNVGEYNIKKQMNRDFHLYNLWREVSFYEYVKENIIKKRVCPNFPLLYAYFINKDCKIDFDKLNKITRKEGSNLDPRFNVKRDKLGERGMINIDGKSIDPPYGYNKENKEKDVGYAINKMYDMLTKNREKILQTQLGGSGSGSRRLNILFYNVYWKALDGHKDAYNTVKCQQPDGSNICMNNIIANIKSKMPLDLIGLVEVANENIFINQIENMFSIWNSENADKEQVSMKYVMCKINNAIIMTFYNSNYLTLDEKYFIVTPISNQVTSSGELCGTLHKSEGRPYQILIFKEGVVLINMHRPHHDIDVNGTINTIIKKLSGETLNHIKDYRFIITGDMNLDIAEQYGTPNPELTFQVDGQTVTVRQNNKTPPTCCDTYEGTVDDGKYNNVYDHILDSHEKGAYVNIVEGLLDYSSDHKSVYASLEPVLNESMIAASSTTLYYQNPKLEKCNKLEDELSKTHTSDQLEIVIIPLLMDLMKSYDHNFLENTLKIPKLSEEKFRNMSLNNQIAYAKASCTVISDYEKSQTTPATLTSTPPATLTPTPLATITPTPSETITPTPLATITPTPSETITPTPLATITPTPSETITPTPLATITPTPPETITPTPTPTPPAIITPQTGIRSLRNQPSILNPTPSSVSTPPVIPALLSKENIHISKQPVPTSKNIDIYTNAPVQTTLPINKQPISGVQFFKVPDQIQAENGLTDNSGSALVALTEAPTYNLVSWASRTYTVDGNVKRMVNTGFHDSKVWFSIFFQILAALYTMQVHGLAFTDFSVYDNIYIKDLKITSNVTNHWKYIVDGVEYYIPNYGYLVIIDSNYKDVEQDNSLTSTTNKYKVYAKMFSETKQMSDYVDDLSFEAFKNTINPSTYSTAFTNAGGNKPPDDVINLLSVMFRDSQNSLNRDVGTYITKYMKMFLNNRIGTLLREDEVKNVLLTEREQFKRGDMLVHQFKHKAYKFVLYLEQTGNVVTVMSREAHNKDVEQMTVTVDQLFNYSQISEPIKQNYKPTESNMNEEQMLEVYIINKI